MKIAPPNHILATCLAVSLAIAPIVGCSKKEGDTPLQQKGLTSSSLLDEPLLQKIPNTTAALAVMNFAGEGYKRFMASPWGNDMRGLNALKSAVEEVEASGASDHQIKIAKTILNSLQKLGLVSPEGKSQVEKVISEAVGFISIRKDTKAPLDLGVFARGATGVNLSDQATSLKQILSDAGLKVADEHFGATKGFVATMPVPQEEGLPIALYVVGTQDTFGMALSKEAVEGLLGAGTTNGMANLKALPEFSKAEESVRSSEAPLSFAFLSVSSFLTNFAPKRGESDAGFDPQEIPVTSLAMSQIYSEQMVTLAGVTVTPRNELQKSVFAAFENSGIPTNAFKLPADTALSLSLDTRVITKLESALKSLNDPSAAMVVEQLKNIQGITLGLRNGDQASPLPDIYLTLDTSARDQVASTVESGIGLGMMATGQQLQWNSKEISGAPTRYIMTPLGVGVYLSSPKNSSALVVASSERAVQDIATSNSGGASLDISMPRALRNRVAESSSGSLYLNFIQLATLLDGVKGTVESMMGPNPELGRALDSANLKKLGIGIGSLSYANGVFKIKSVFDRGETP
ncbi:MAG: hypothetical protein RIS36_347 [Pseudomonadota bacterium]|jgi:hypothetical protein